jgi:hypothetical protein
MYPLISNLFPMKKSSSIGSLIYSLKLTVDCDGIFFYLEVPFFLFSIPCSLLPIPYCLFPLPAIAL